MDSHRWQRYEAKYFINEARAEWVRSFCRANLSYDPYSAERPNSQYPILSVYFDSADEQCLRGTLERRAVRAKLRARVYCDVRERVADFPVYFEIKRKLHGIVQKTRAKVPAGIAHSLLWNGAAPGTVSWAGAAPVTLAGLEEFLCLREQLRAQPKVGVFYTREAYESETADRVRISLDRHLQYGDVHPPWSSECDTWWPVGLAWTILEIKFTETFPGWVADLTRVGEITRRGVCKFVMCTRAAQGELRPAVV